MSRPTGSGRGLAFGGLLLGGGLALVAATRPWSRAVAGDAEVEFTGAAVSGGLASALSLVLLAGTLLAATLRRRGRRVLAALLAAAAAATAVLGLVRPEPSGDAVLTELRRVTLTDSSALTGTAWPWVYAGAGLVALAGALTLGLRAGRWPQRGDRFRRAPAAGPDADPAAVWAALDAGLDPTLDNARDPDVRPVADPSDNGTTKTGPRPARPGPPDPPSQ